MPTVTSAEWDRFISNLRDAHFMQSSAWGELKSAYGWYNPVFFIAGTSGAQLLLPRLPSSLRIAYIPKGPVGRNWRSLWAEIDQYCKQQGVVFLKVEPDVNEPVNSQLIEALVGFKPVQESIQPRCTIVINLDGNKDTWLSRMKKKTRYNIGLAERHGVIVSITSDIENFSQIMQTTAKRNAFKARSKEYYQKTFDVFANSRELGNTTQGVMIRVDYNQIPLASVFACAHGRRAWTLYGGTSNAYRNLMPAYLMYYEIMRWAASQGCEQLDLFGIPDFDEETLESNFTNRSDGLWKVYRFKRGFGGAVTRHVCGWDRIYKPALYQLYRLFSSVTGIYKRL